MSETEQPIIIKKKKKGGHGGHHGGAWKVAYADFVTAMMAFFLVMWILGLSPTSKKRIANFFREPGVFQFMGGKKMPMDLDLQPGSKGNEGNGAGSEAILNEKEKVKLAEERMEKLPIEIKEAIHQEAIIDSIKSAEKVAHTAESIKKELQATAVSDSNIRKQLESLQVTVSSEGLRIEMLESKDNIFFAVGSSQLLPAGVTLLKNIAKLTGQVDNCITIEGHTDSRQFSNETGGYSNWELSTERANAARRVLESNGLWKGQISLVVGYADRRLLNPTDPFAMNNRRVSIVLQNKTSTDFVLKRLDKIEQDQAPIEEPQSLNPEALHQQQQTTQDKKEH